ncbi:MAG: 30S ribosomal protein S18 [Patescibacteria group bacterium]|jgi:small subunit ribosomal protein S18
MAKTKTIGTKERYCNFCVNQEIPIDYKNTDLLKRYVSSFGKIVPRKRSGLCSLHQRKMSLAIKRARIMALLPFVQK